MTHKVNSKGVAIEHSPNNKVKRIRNGINQLGPEKRYTHTKYETSFLDVEKKYYTFAQAKAKGWVTQKDKEKYNKKLKRAENKPEMFDPPGLTMRQIRSITKLGKSKN